MSARAVARTDIEEKVADSMRTLVVALEISVSRPPITPATATGLAASAMTHIPLVSS